MKTLITTIALAALSQNLQAVNNVTWNLVEAIRQVESGGRNIAGDHGMARGQWQFWAIAWKDVNNVRATYKLKTFSYEFAKTKTPYQLKVARVYAHDYLEILRGRFMRKAKREPSVAELWAVWNIGLSRFFTDHNGDFDKIPKRTQLNAAVIENMIRRNERDGALK